MPERGRLDRGRRDHATATLVVIEPEIVFERIGSHQVVVALRKAEHNAARSVLAPRHWPEARADHHIGVGAPPGATMTLNSLAVARCTSARPLCAAPGTSSMPHSPSIRSHPKSGP